MVDKHTQITTTPKQIPWKVASSFTADMCSSVNKTLVGRDIKILIFSLQCIIPAAACFDTFIDLLLYVL